MPIPPSPAPPPAPLVTVMGVSGSVDELVANAHAAVRSGVDSITVVAGGASWRM